MTIGATSPAARAHQEKVDAELADEADGIYTDARAARLLRKGELTYDEVLTAAKEGRIRTPAKPYPVDTTDPDELDANSSYDPFAALLHGNAATPPVLTQAQYRDLKLARTGYVGDDDPASTWPESTRVKVEDPTLVPPGEYQPKVRPDGEPNDYRYYTVGEPPTAVLRVKGPFVESYQPQSKQWISAPFFFDSVFGDDAHESTEVTMEAAEALVASGQGLYEIPSEDLASLASAR